MSFFEELKRRNVFKVGIAYVVAAWLILQMTEVLSELMELNTDIGKVIIILLTVGFIPAVIFAWAFEMTPDGVKREKDVDRSQSITPNTGKKLNNTILVMMALAIGYLLFDKFSAPGSEPFSQPSSQHAQVDEKMALSPVEAEATPTIKRQSIAVLPFDNRSRNVEDEYFTAGIHDDLLTKLALIGSLKVISRTSVNQYKGTEKTITQIAAELGVATVMEGAVQRAGNTVRINVQLIDAQTDEHLWAKIFDRELTTDNLFAIQTEISGAIAAALKTTLTTAEQAQINRRPTDNLAAYHAFTRGRQLQDKRTSAALEQALTEFRRAVELDPLFAQAWVGVADTLILSSSYGTLETDAAIAQASPAIERALKIDRLLGQAHTSRGYLLAFSAPWADVEAEFKRGIELNPNYARAFHWYSHKLRRQPARLDDSLAMGQKAVELDPMSPILRQNVAGVYRALGEFKKAEAGWLEVLELNPEFAPAFNALSLLHGQVYGHYDEALRWVLKSRQLDPGNIGYMLDEFMPLVLAGASELAANSMKNMEDLDPDSQMIPFALMLQNVLGQRYAAAAEQANYLAGKQNLPATQWLAGAILAYGGNYAKARELMLRAEPGYSDPEQWQRLLTERQTAACQIGWVLMRTGDASQGRDLIQRTILYLEETLPRYIKHADRYGVQICHAALGRKGAALDAMELTAAHKHFGNWKFNHLWPPVRDLWDEPRYIAVRLQVEEEVARQRQVIESMYASKSTSP